jgi:hypothetical protein
MWGVRKLMVLLAVVGALFVSAALPAFAHEEGNDFVCPVFKSAAVGEHNPNAVEIGDGDYTILPGYRAGLGEQRADHLDVPDKATNMNGNGSPPGAHASPGDPNYTAIWNGD